jgi:hypothetical protein
MEIGPSEEMEITTTTIQTNAPAAPDWATTTPPETDYELIMWASGDEAVQKISVTRTEFEAAKRVVAEMRGHLQAERDVILQREMQAYADLNWALHECALSIRRRLRAGAAVEPGRWTLDETAASPIEEYETSVSRDTYGASVCDLTLELA